jgi:hypothetical protein
LANRTKDKDDARAYCRRKDVSDAMGKVTGLSVIGYVITRDTFGARIALDDTELDLFDQKEGAEAELEKNSLSLNKGQGKAAQSSKKPSLRERQRMEGEEMISEKSSGRTTMVATEMDPESREGIRHIYVQSPKT